MIRAESSLVLFSLMKWIWRMNEINLVSVLISCYLASRFHKYQL